jgi:hypothetical protein
MGDSGNYLLGYIPNETDNPFAPVKEKTVNETVVTNTVQKEQDKLLESGKGMAIRYKQAGKKAAEAEEQYSEIGFYHEKTMWTAKQKEEFNEVLEEDNVSIPKIDKIHIHSTGDIKTDAANHQLIMAKRMEILSDCPEIDHLKGTDADGKLPLGDVKGDDSALHRGDIHIRAGGRVVIKAAEKIQLQAGRTILEIDDTGFNVITKKINSNWPNSFDTSLALNPRSGITMFGQGVNITSAYSTKIGDSLGGGLSFSSGVASLSGREIQLGTQGQVEYLWLLAAAGLELGVNTAMISSAKGGADPSANSAIAIITLVKDDLKEIRELASKFYELAKKAGELNFKRKLKELKKKLDALDKSDPNYQTAKENLQKQYKEALDWQENKTFEDAQEDLDKRKKDDWTLTDESVKEVAAKAEALAVMANNKKLQAEAADQKAAELEKNNAGSPEAAAARAEADKLKKESDQMTQQAAQAQSDVARMQTDAAQRKTDAAERQADQDKKNAAAASTVADAKEKAAEEAKKEADAKVVTKEKEAATAKEEADKAREAAKADPSDTVKEQKASEKEAEAKNARDDADKAKAEADKKETEAQEAQNNAKKAKAKKEHSGAVVENNNAQTALKLTEEKVKRAKDALAKSPTNSSLKQAVEDAENARNAASKRVTKAQDDLNAAAEVLKKLP